MTRKQIKKNEGAAGAPNDSYATTSQSDIEIRALARLAIIVLRRPDPARTELWKMIFGTPTHPMSNKIIYEET